MDGIPIWEKYALTVDEAAQYFGLGTNKLRRIAHDFFDYGIVLQNGNKVLFKREKFEKFLNETNSI